MEDGIVYVLSAALKSGITAEDGVAEHRNFHDCPVLQINEVPTIEVHIAPSNESPQGGVK